MRFRQVSQAELDQAVVVVYLLDEKHSDSLRLFHFSVTCRVSCLGMPFSNPTVSGGQHDKLCSGLIESRVSSPRHHGETAYAWGLRQALVLLFDAEYPPLMVLGRADFVSRVTTS